MVPSCGGTPLRWTPRPGSCNGRGTVSRSPITRLHGSLQFRCSTSPNGVSFIWRPDGKSLVVLKHSVSPPDPHFSLCEARLDGTARWLRDLGAEFPVKGTRDGAFISDQLLVAGNALEQLLIPTGGGSATRLPVGTGTRFSKPGVSPCCPDQAKWILWLVQDGDRPITSVEVMTSSGDSVRTLNLPFEVDRRPNYDSFRADAGHIILVPNVPGESVSKIFLVPLNGGTPRVLTQFSGRLSARFVVSPDGKSLVYSLEGAPTSKIYELDMTPILQSIGKH